MCLPCDGRNRSVEAIRLAFGGQPLAVVVVAEVLKCTFAAPKQEHSEHRVKIPTGGVIRVSPDPVGAAPPELTIVTRVYADGAIAVCVNDVSHCWISNVIRRKLLVVEVPFNLPRPEVHAIVTLETNVFGQ